jgi:hypothetical protein
MGQVGSWAWWTTDAQNYAPRGPSVDRKPHRELAAKVKAVLDVLAPAVHPGPGLVRRNVRRCLWAGRSSGPIRSDDGLRVGAWTSTPPTTFLTC